MNRDLPIFCAIAFFAAVGVTAIVTADVEDANWTVANACVQENGETLVQFDGKPEAYYQIQASTDLRNWLPLATVEGAGKVEYTDGSARYKSSYYYRATEQTGEGIVTGDHLQTENGDLLIHPVNHASFVLLWNGISIYSDPVGSASLYSGLPLADVVLVTHEHGDHFNDATINTVLAESGVVIAPQETYSRLRTTLRSANTPMANGESREVGGVTVDAVPSYNSRHPKGRGNAYIVTIGGKRIYISGDTGDIAEMRALQNIDVAFLCMNVPFTMTVSEAASAVRDFKPSVVYPYHYRNQNNSLSDLVEFTQLVGANDGVEVRRRSWY
ncbi:MAG: MBL fold metallo-hydrolase [Verrucomicrobiae bacterium]|nr:MBL fold metallo-hydrolase [Verrucomicrobiae bacterium]